MKTGILSAMQATVCINAAWTGPGADTKTVVLMLYAQISTHATENALLRTMAGLFTITLMIIQGHSVLSQEIQRNGHYTIIRELPLRASMTELKMISMSKTLVFVQ